MGPVPMNHGEHKLHIKNHGSEEALDAMIHDGLVEDLVDGEPVFRVFLQHAKSTKSRNPAV